MSFTVLSHCVAFVYVSMFYNSAAIVLEQLRPLLLVSLICACSTLAFRSRMVLVYVMAFRLLVVVLALALLEGKNVVAEILLILPLIVEITDRFHWIAGLAGSSAVVLIAQFVDLLSLFSVGVTTAIQHEAVILVVAIPTSVLGSLLSRTSDLLQQKSMRIQELGRAVENLTSSNKAFQDYAETIGSLSTEQERNRITRELHDLTGYALTNIIMLMNAGRVFLGEDPRKLGEILDSTKQQADSALTEIRRILYQLRAVKTPALTGLQAIDQLVRTFSDATNVKVSVNYGNFPNSYGERVDEVIYRIVQEGLTNALRHGRARKVTIIFWETDKDIVVSVGDNGEGAGTFHEGIGLRGIKERLSALCGNLEVHGTRYGFELVSRIPRAGNVAVREGGDGHHQDHDC